MVRVAGLEAADAAGVAVTSNSGLMPRELHDAILTRTQELVADHAQVFAEDIGRRSPSTASRSCAGTSSRPTSARR